MNNKFFLLIGLWFFLLSACKDKKKEEPDAAVVDYMQVTMQPVFGPNNLHLEQTVISNEGYRIQFTELKCYFTSVQNGSNILSQSALFDYRTNGNQFFTKQGSPSNFSSISCLLGVDSIYNHLDPAAFDNDNPLNITIANDMHWDWNPGYIFIKVEAKVDTLDDGVDNFNHFVVFHIGGDEMIQHLNFPAITWTKIADHLYHLPLKLDMQYFLENNSHPIDLKIEHTSHSAVGQEALSLKVIQNFRDAISLY